MKPPCTCVYPALFTHDKNNSKHCIKHDNLSIIRVIKKGVHDDSLPHSTSWMKMKEQNEFMLTPKDVLYISDILDQTLALNKRVANDLTMIENSDVKQCFKHVNQKLCEHYDTLLGLLEREAK